MKEKDNAVISAIKSMIFPIILVAIIAVGVIVIINYKAPASTEESIRPYGYDGDDSLITISNNKLEFTMDPLTTQFVVKVKETGKEWRSNPENGATDPLAQSSEKGRLQSTLLMQYTKMEGLLTEYDAFDYSVSKGLYEIEKGTDSIKVKYSIGNIEREYYIPPVTTEDRFDALVALMDKEGANMVKRYYKKYDINNLGKKDDKDQLLADYPILETEVIYVLRNTVNASLCTKMEEIFEAAGYTMEDYKADKELNNAEKTSDKPVFNITVEYKLEGEDLVVSVPLSEVQYPSKYPIYSLTLLPYFGAGGKEDEGYILVPEGGGALINFNNGKTAQNGYYAKVYGWDMATTRDAVVHNTKTYYNVYGIANGEDSFLCILEDGAPYADIQANVYGKNNSYNYANAIYSIVAREKYDIGDLANSDVYVFMPELPDETLVQRYRFENTNDYSELAQVYQNYLVNKYSGYMTKNTDTSTPVAVEIIGAVDKVKQVLGVPVSRPLKLTTYKEAADMISELNSEGIKNLSVKLTGWCNGGVNQKVLNKVKLISDLGSSKDLKNLSTTASDLGVNLYLDGVTQYAYDSDILDGFNSFTDAARFVTKERAKLFVYSRVTYAAREGVDNYYLLSAGEVDKMVQNLNKAANKYNTGVSFREIGEMLCSDFNRKKLLTRQASMEYQESTLKQMADDGTNIMINMGNDFVAPYADMITNMDLQGDEYTIIDAFVPFYQMALHGYVNYTGDPLNLAGDMTDELLRSAEYGAGLSFTVMRESAFALQKTLYTEYFGSDYSRWHDKILEIYNQYNKDLGHTFKQRIVDHTIVEENVACTTYEDGTKVYVNYNVVDTNIDGVKVGARSYKVVR